MDHLILLIVSSILFPLLLLLVFLWTSKSSLPPGPWGLPLLGHLHLLFKLPPHKALHSMAQKYGPIIFLRLGMNPTVVISNHALAKELFTSHDISFADRPYLVVGEHINYGSVSIATSSYGDHWRNSRKVCAMELFTVRRIDSFSWLRNQELSHALDVVRGCGDRPVNLRSVLSNFSFNNMTRILMSKRYFGDGEVDPDALEFKEFVKEVVRLTIKPCVSHFVPWYLRWLDWDIPYYRHIHARQDKFLQKIIDEHKGSSRECQDFVDIMLAYFGGDAQAEVYTKANLVDMIIAGSDTTAVTSEWLMSALIHNPEVMKKAREELDRVVGRSRMVRESDFSKLEYFQAVLKETFRLYSVAVMLMPRMAGQTTRIGGYTVPKGTTLLVNVWSVHTDPAVWENPTEFLPDRFYSSSVDYKGQSFELIPFGSGRRKCPGMSLGLRTLELLVTNLIHGFDWSFPPGTTPSMEEVITSVSQPKSPLQAMATPRLSKEAYASF